MPIPNNNNYSILVNTPTDINVLIILHAAVILNRWILTMYTSIPLRAQP